MDTAIVLNEAQFLEFVHEEINSGARSPDHFRQRLLRYFGKPLLRLVNARHSERARQRSARASRFSLELKQS